MNNDQKHSDFHLTARQMQDYLSGNLSDVEMHHIEKHLLECDFCAEAMEGLEAMVNVVDFEKDISTLKKRIEKRTQTTRKEPVFLYKRVLKIAAMVAVLVVASVLITNYFRSNIALKEFSEKKKTELPKDKKDNDIGEEKQEELSSDTTLKPTEEKSPKGNQENSKPELVKEDDPVIEDKIDLVDNDNQAKSIESLDEETITMDEVAAIDDEIVYAETETAEEDLADVESLEVEEEMVMGMEADDSAIPAVTRERSMYSAAGANAKVAEIPSSRSIYGTISDENNTPLPFVTVQVKNNEIETASDIDGRFIMAIPEGNQTLLVSYIGYETEEIEVALQDTFSIVLRANDLALEEIVAGSAAKQKKSESKKEIIKPKPINGDAYPQYLKDSLRCPEAALEAKIKGSVTLQFMVDSNGEISQIEVLKSLGFGCDEEAIRLVSEGPKWVPGSEDGEPTEMEAELKVKFK